MTKNSIWILVIFLFACRQNGMDQQVEPPTPPPTPVPVDQQNFDILALGDSYTKGQGVPLEQSFPYQLADTLRQRGYQLIPGTPKVIAQTGWRTDNLLNAWNSQPAEIRDSIFSMVTLLIGVNNQFQNSDFNLYKPQFEQLLNIAIARAGGKPERVFVLSIPDYAYTPAGQSFGPPLEISQEIDQYNQVNAAVAAQKGVKYIEVTGISRNGLSDPTLVATDGLHPSGKQYTAWVQKILE